MATSANLGTPAPAQNNSLSAIACVSSADCWAVGAYDSGGSIYQTLVEHWNGTSWTLPGSPNSSVTQTNQLGDVACASTSDCTAVGFYDSGGGVAQTLVEKWNGTSWSIVSSANVSPTQSSVLTGIACNSSSDCWASGAFLNGSVAQTLIEHWNGATWAIVSSPNTSGAQSNKLSGIACTSASNCWAAGYYNNGTVDQTLVERWNGTAWSIVASPNTSTSQNDDLYGITCGSANDCWAVGAYSGTVQQTLTEHWNGTAWTIIASPNSSASLTNSLQRVACSSSSDCIAVGQSGSTPAQTLIEQWNGAAWSIATSANSDATHSNVLSGVACSGASDCWTVGEFSTSTFMQTLIEKRTLPLLLITSVARPATGPMAGHFLITGKAVPNSTVNIQTSPDLIVSFGPLGSAASDVNGIFQYDDPPSSPKKFFRATYP